MKIKRWITLGLLCLVLAACNYPDDNTPTPTPMPQSGYLWIDAPLDGSSIPLEPYKIVIHGVVGPPVEYKISINGIVMGTAPPMPTKNWSLSSGEYLWTPPAPGLYTIAVGLTDNPGINPSAYIQIRVNVLQPNVVEDGQPIPKIPTETPTPEPKTCTLTALVNLFCRPGPGYDPVDEFTPGQSALVVAQSEFLWQVNGLNSGRLCTVPKADNMVEVEPKEGCENLPVFTPPPTPIPTVSSRQQPQCNDGVDNDNDGYIDLRDPQCSSAGDNDESVP